MKKITLLFASLCLLMQMDLPNLELCRVSSQPKRMAFPLSIASILVKGQPREPLPTLMVTTHSSSRGGTLVFTYVGMKTRTSTKI